MPLRKSIFLADDDADDRMLFEEALKEVSGHSLLTTAKDGIQLMSILDKSVPPPPDLVFLDLNMPRKNGFECLQEMRQNVKFKDIPVIIFSTSSQQEAINKVYKDGANFYICKPGSFPQLKTVIQKILAINWLDNKAQPPKDKFLISA